jgi:hypothetical protein
LEKVVAVVQLTVVCPDVFCTSMAVPVMEATLPLAEPGGAVAAPAAVA